MAATIIDAVIIIMLAGAIAYGFMISAKVRRLMAVLKELEPLVQEFSQAVDKSEQSVEQMKDSIEARKTQDQTDWQEEDVRAEDDAPAFASRRQPSSKMPGMQIVRDKKDLVRMFFEASRVESRT
jgi:outer membrane murein-binding lipoprotein Lpp